MSIIQQQLWYSVQKWSAKHVKKITTNRSFPSTWYTYRSASKDHTRIYADLRQAQSDILTNTLLRNAIYVDFIITEQQTLLLTHLLNNLKLKQFKNVSSYGEGSATHGQHILGFPTGTTATACSLLLLGQWNDIIWELHIPVNSISATVNSFYTFKKGVENFLSDLHYTLKKSLCFFLDREVWCGLHTGVFVTSPGSLWCHGCLCDVTGLRDVTCVGMRSIQQSSGKGY